MILEKYSRDQKLLNYYDLLHDFLVSIQTKELVLNVLDTEKRKLNYNSKATEFAWGIQYYDEVLTHSIARYIDSGDSIWVNRYNEIAPLLDQVFVDAYDTLTPEEMAIFDEVADVNNTLIDYETTMIGLVEAGNPLEAKSILNGDYTDQKQVLIDGIYDFFDVQQSKMLVGLQNSEQLSEDLDRNMVILIAVIVIICITKIYNNNRILNLC
jgi:hypothetical protein